MSKLEKKNKNVAELVFSFDVLSVYKFIKIFGLLSSWMCIEKIAQCHALHQVFPYSYPPTPYL